MDRKSDNRKRKYQIMALFFGAAFLCCIVWIAAYLAGLRRAETEMETVRESYVTREEETTGTDADGEGFAGTQEAGDTPETEQPSGEEAEELQSGGDTGYSVPEMTVDIGALQQEVNADIYAWITVPGTVIDYPVLQHPEEMDYYLEYNLDGTKGYPGCIYTQRMNGKEWEDVNTVLYGHNMKNGSMFAELHKFKDESFFEENRYIYVYTEDGRILVYEIFAAYVSGNEHLLMTYDLYTEAGIQGYFDSIFSHTGSGCHFLEDVELTAEDKIITLSTCISGQADKRYLVQGVLRAEEEQP